MRQTIKVTGTDQYNRDTIIDVQAKDYARGAYEWMSDTIDVLERCIDAITAGDGTIDGPFGVRLDAKDQAKVQIRKLKDQASTTVSAIID